MIQSLRYLALAVAAIAVVAVFMHSPRRPTPADRQEVVFWHFWGGADLEVVESIVEDFNNSQEKYFVRAVAMPGNNLDVKLFLAVTGGNPPDLINQDDPIIADWSTRGALLPLENIASPEEIEELNTWLFPAALRLGSYENRLYGLCNGLDIRALYYNRTLLESHGLEVPQAPADLDNIAEVISPPDRKTIECFGYLPDPRRLEAWTATFGGSVYNEAAKEVTFDDPQVVAALDWMTGYRRRYGASRVAAFRVGDQSLPGKTFPLLPVGSESQAGRYAVLMDGQWRVRDIAAFLQSREEQNQPAPEFGVCPLPAPAGGRSDAGWVNGNFFIVPNKSKNPAGAWAFMKFWSGLGHEKQAAKICAKGGWIPASRQVVEQPEFQEYLSQQPLFAEFVRLAGSENQIPTPVIPGAPILKRELVRAATKSMYEEDAPPPAELLKETGERIQQRLKPSH